MSWLIPATRDYKEDPVGKIKENQYIVSGTSIIYLLRHSLERKEVKISILFIKEIKILSSIESKISYRVKNILRFFTFTNHERWIIPNYTLRQNKKMRIFLNALIYLFLFIWHYYIGTVRYDQIGTVFAEILSWTALTWY